MKNIVILGGGSAGWMAANLIALRLKKFAIKITVIESSKKGTVGVGEGSTPYLREFFEQLNIPEYEWMPACNATYKCGIRFPDWAPASEQSSYFHPFYSDADGTLAQQFFSQCNNRRQGHAAATNPDDYFITTYLANNKKAPKADVTLEGELTYGYHFDAVLLGEFLRAHAIKLGVHHIDDEVTDIICNKAGDIAILQTEKSGPIRGDFFVDCSGFNGLLIQQTLGEKIQSFQDYLFNDSAVAIQTPHDNLNSLMCETESKATKHGWTWHIPLMNRMGNGYVYSSAHISKEQAEQELRELLGEQAEGKSALHLKWQPGRIEQHWKQNCVAIGLSQGFLEPLEAPMLYIIQRSIEEFIAHLIKGQLSSRFSSDFNDKINQIIDGTKDYLQAHYKLNTRQDSEYWRQCRDNPVMSDTLSDLLSAWQSTDNFDQALQTHNDKLSYLKTSWYCLFAGKGAFSDSNLMQRDNSRASNELAELVAPFPDHFLYLQQFAMNKGH